MILSWRFGCKGKYSRYFFAKPTQSAIGTELSFGNRIRSGTFLGVTVLDKDSWCHVSFFII